MRCSTHTVHLIHHRKADRTPLVVRFTVRGSAGLAFKTRGVPPKVQDTRFGGEAGPQLTVDEPGRLGRHLGALDAQSGLREVLDELHGEPLPKNGSRVPEEANQSLQPTTQRANAKRIQKDVTRGAAALLVTHEALCGRARVNVSKNQFCTQKRTSTRMPGMFAESTVTIVASSLSSTLMVGGSTRRARVVNCKHSFAWPLPC